MSSWILVRSLYNILMGCSGCFSVSRRCERAHFGILDVFFLHFINIFPDLMSLQNLVICLGMFRGFEVAGSILINKEMTIGPSSPATLTYGLGP